jgi:hypothetical protein
MIWPFKRKPLLDEEATDWHLENFEWLVSCYAANQSLSAATLVLPKPNFFLADGEKGHAKAERIFAQVKEYCQIADWPTELVRGDPFLASGRTLFEVQHGKSVLGTYDGYTSNKIRITYAPNLLENPQALIATLAHEIGHGIIHAAPKKPICADDEHEFLTDLAAVYLGFGVFLANTAFQFTQWRDDALGTQGWQSSRSGYLPEADLVFATAIFIRAKRIDPTEARSCLKPHLASMLDKALRDLDARETDIARIRSLEARHEEAVTASIIQEAPQLP